MNLSPENQKDNWDRLLDESLKSLPERQAPEDLLINVMAKIASQEDAARLSWYTRLRWPVVVISSTLVFLAAYFSDSILESLWGYLKPASMVGKIQEINEGIQVVSVLLNACAKVLSLIPIPWLFTSAAVIFLFSACSCAGFGTVLFRLTRNYP